MPRLRIRLAAGKRGNNSKKVPKFTPQDLRKKREAIIKKINNGTMKDPRRFTA